MCVCVCDECVSTRVVCAYSSGGSWWRCPSPGRGKSRRLNDPADPQECNPSTLWPWNTHAHTYSIHTFNLMVFQLISTLHDSLLTRNAQKMNPALCSLWTFALLKASETIWKSNRKVNGLPKTRIVQILSLSANSPCFLGTANLFPSLSSRVHFVNEDFVAGFELPHLKKSPFPLYFSPALFSQ